MELREILEGMKINETRVFVVENGCLVYELNIFKESEECFRVEVRDLSGYSENDSFTTDLNELCEMFGGYGIIENYEVF